MSGMHFFLVNKQISPSLWKPIYKSEIKAAAKGYYEWSMVNLLSSDIAGEDVDREVKIEFYQSAKSGKHKHIASVALTLAQIKEGQQEYNLVDKKSRPIGEHKMNFVQLEVKKRHSFLEYIFGGC